MSSPQTVSPLSHIVIFISIIFLKYFIEKEGLLVLMKPAVEEYARKNREKSRKYLEDIGK